MQVECYTLPLSLLLDDFCYLEGTRNLLTFGLWIKELVNFLTLKKFSHKGAMHSSFTYGRWL